MLTTLCCLLFGVVRPNDTCCSVHTADCTRLLDMTMHAANIYGLHVQGTRRVQVHHCPAIIERLVEAALFGHVRRHMTPCVCVHMVNR